MRRADACTRWILVVLLLGAGANAEQNPEPAGSHEAVDAETERGTPSTLAPRTVSSRGFGARSAFGIRGLKVFVDGIPATLPDGQTGVDSIDLGSTHRIEVMRGPASSLFGAAAGGVIHILTEDGPDEPFVEGRLSLGEGGFRKVQGKTGGRLASLAYLVSLSDFELDGHREQSRTRSSLLNAKFRYDIDASSDFTLVVNALRSPRADDPGGLTRDQARADSTQASARNLLFDAGEWLDQQKFGWVYRKAFGPKHEIVARNYVLWRDFDNRLPFTDGGSVRLRRFFAGGGLRYRWTDTLWGHRNQLVLGLDVDAQRDARQRFDNLDDDGGVCASTRTRTSPRGASTSRTRSTSGGTWS